MDDVAPLKTRTAADSISAFAAYCKGVSPTIAAEGVLEHERAGLLNSIALIDAWLGRLVVLLSAPAVE